MQREIWKPIMGYEGIYEISNLGKVRNAKGKILQADKRLNTGYMYVVLRKGKDYPPFHANIHRLVAKSFIPNPNNYPIVNHINENRMDNRVENLEWCDFSYNIRVSTKHQKTYKGVIQLTIDEQVIQEHKSIHEAARFLRRKDFATHICACLKGRCKTALGYKWKYINK